MRKIISGLMLLLTLTHLSAQKSISRQVIASGGGTLSNRNIHISYTVGETVIETFSKPRILLSQGFQQPDKRGSFFDMNIADITSFDAYTEYRIAKLLLVTNTGFKTDYFVLERLNNDNGKFEPLEKRNVTAAVRTLADYSFTDKNPQEGDNFYRIMQITQQNDSVFTEVKKLTFNTLKDLTLFPNPASDYVNVDLSQYQGKSATLSVYSALGQLLLYQAVESIGKEPIKIHLDGIETGSFQLNIAIKGQRVMARQLIVAKE